MGNSQSQLICIKNNFKQPPILKPRPPHWLSHDIQEWVLGVLNV